MPHVAKKKKAFSRFRPSPDSKVDDRKFKAKMKAENRPYAPRGGAVKLFFARETEVLMDGPAGTGKTRAILEKVHALLIKYPKSRIIGVRKTRKSMTESVLVTFEDEVVPEGSPILNGPSRQMRHSYKYPNGSEFVIGGMDDAAKIMSSQYDVIAVFEATELTEDDYEKLLTRMRNARIPYQQLLADCNPAGPAHWLNQRCISGKCRRIKSRHKDNPSVTPQYLEILSNLTGVRRKRLFLGIWAAQEGLVYEDFSDIHLIDKMPKGWRHWRKFRTIDFGFTNPFVCQWWAIDPDGRLYLYREIYMTQTIVEDHAKEIKRLSKGDENLLGVAVCDHDAEDRATLERHGVRTAPAYKNISRGIQAVQARLRKAGDGKPRIFFLRTALVTPDPYLVEQKQPLSTIEEFGEYIWPPDPDKKNKSKKEVPMDLYNHGMDSMRYAVARLDLRRVSDSSIPVGTTYYTG